MESPKKISDPTMNHRINKRNTFNHIFPSYAPALPTYMSSTQSSFTNSLDYSRDSDFVIHNGDNPKKVYNKKVDRIVFYTESMLKIKNMRKLNR
jgi:hypothetical protein